MSPTANDVRRNDSLSSISVGCCIPDSLQKDTFPFDWALDVIFAGTLIRIQRELDYMGVRNPSKDAKEKARAAEREAWRFEGYIDGFVFGLVTRGQANAEFNQDEWESLYGEYVIHDSYRTPIKNPTKEEARQYLVTEWDHAEEKKFLPGGNDLPKGRDGMLVFENKIAALTHGGKRYLIELTESEYQFLEKLDEVRMEILREGYGRT